MKTLYQINLIALITTVVLYIPALLGVFLHPLLGLIQIISLLVILSKYQSLSSVIKKHITIYMVLVTLISIPMLFGGDIVLMVFFIGSLVLAIYFVIITYLLYKSKES